MGGCRGVQAVQGCLEGSRGFQRKTAKNMKKPEKRSGTLWLAFYARPNGSGYLGAVAHPPHFKVLGGGKGEVKPPKCPTRQSGLADYARQTRLY